MLVIKSKQLIISTIPVCANFKHYILYGSGLECFHRATQNYGMW